MKFFNAIFLLIPFFAFLSQVHESATIESTVVSHISIEDIEAITKADDKKVIIKLSAAWCKPCKKLSKTLEDKEIQSYLSDNFHVVDFDIQTKGSITYKGKSYDYVDDPKMGYHALAYELLENRLSFPALLVLDTQLNKIDLTRGYKNKRQLLDYLKNV